MKNIKLEDRLIFALDVPEVSDAKEIVTELDDSVNFYKIGMEMLMTGQYFELLDWLIKKDKNTIPKDLIFDFKFNTCLVEIINPAKIQN